MALANRTALTARLQLVVWAQAEREERRWFKDRRMEIYARKTHIPSISDHLTLTLASAWVYAQGEGTFDRLLRLLEHELPNYPIKIENVRCPRFQTYLVRRGYRPLPKYTDEDLQSFVLFRTMGGCAGRPNHEIRSQQ